MILGDIALTEAYQAGSGHVFASSMANVLARMDGTPTRLTLYRRGDLSTYTTYKLTSAAGSRAGISTVLEGTDRNYSAGDLVFLQGNTADILSDAASGGGTYPTKGLVIETHTAPIGTAADGVTVTFDLGTNDWWQVTLGGNRTLALANAATGQVFYIKLIQDGTGSRTISNWFTMITWYTSTFAAPTLPTGAGKAILCGFRCTGSGTYDGFVVGASGS